MMEELIEILQKSVEKNGVIPLTNQHLLNILKMAIKRQEMSDYYDAVYNNVVDDSEWG